MIQRVVLVQLKDQYRDAASRRQIADHTESVLGQIPLIRELRVGLPPNRGSARGWDLLILVQLDDEQAIELYRTDPTHRAYADVYLAPLREKIRVWNFELA